MAAFTDQFLRHDPLTFSHEGPLGELVSSLANSALIFFDEGRTANEVSQLCEVIELLISTDVSDPKSRIASVQDELNVVAAMTHYLTGWSKTLGIKPRNCEPSAAYALWKLVDYCDIAQSIQRSGSVPDGHLVAAANASLFGAAKAIALCTEAKGFEKGLRRARQLEYDELSRAMQTKARKKLTARDEHRCFAIANAPSIKARFRIEAARKLAVKIREKFGVNYVEETVDRWLREGNWRRNKK